MVRRSCGLVMALLYLACAGPPTDPPDDAAVDARAAAGDAVVADARTTDARAARDALGAADAPVLDARLADAGVLVVDADLDAPGPDSILAADAPVLDAAAPDALGPPAPPF